MARWVLTAPPVAACLAELMALIREGYGPEDAGAVLVEHHGQATVLTACRVLRDVMLQDN